MLLHDDVTFSTISYPPHNVTHQFDIVHVITPSVHHSHLSHTRHDAISGRSVSQRTAVFYRIAINYIVIIIIRSEVNWLCPGCEGQRVIKLVIWRAL